MYANKKCVTLVIVKKGDKDMSVSEYFSMFCTNLRMSTDTGPMSRFSTS